MPKNLKGKTQITLVLQQFVDNAKQGRTAIGNPQQVQTRFHSTNWQGAILENGFSLV